MKAHENKTGATHALCKAGEPSCVTAEQGFYSRFSEAPPWLTQMLQLEESQSLTRIP